MRLHARTQIVNAASLDLEKAVWKVMADHDLTYIEALKILNLAEQAVIRFALRQERHPRSPNKKADEA